MKIDNTKHEWILRGVDSNIGSTESRAVRSYNRKGAISECD